MINFNNEQWNKIGKAFEDSPIWESLNEGIKKVYEQHNRIPTDEEYQHIRTMLICKTIMEDSDVMGTMARCTWEALRREEMK